MKKLMVLILALMMVLSMAAFAEGEAPASAVTEADGMRYELSEDNTVVTVWLPANETTGYSWEFEISDENLLELVTDEYVPDENPDDLTGVGGTWAASFRNPMGGGEGTGGDVTLKLTYCQSWAPDPENDLVREMHLWAVENGELEIVEVK